jgi:hypothetical protein
MMRILFLDQFSEMGGAQRCLADLIPAVLDRNWSVTVALPGEGPFAQLLRKWPVAVEFLPCGPYTPGRKTVGDVFRFASDARGQAQVVSQLIAKHRPNLIYVNGPRSPYVDTLIRHESGSSTTAPRRSHSRIVSV